MGSYAELYVGRLLVASSKNDIFPDVVGLFQRDEFHSVEVGDFDAPSAICERHFDEADAFESDTRFDERIHYYATTLSEISERLEYLGYSSENARAAFYAWRDRNVAWMNEMAEEERPPSLAALQDRYRIEAEKLSRVSIEEWIEATKELIERGNRKSVSEKARSVLELVGGEYEYDYGPSYDFLISLRIICDLAQPDEVVCYDVTDLVHSEFLDVGDDPVGAVREHEFDSAADIFRNSKTIVLVEGRSDIRLLKAAMTAIFPRLADRFVFFDYEEFGIPGGAGNLVNLVKSFVAAEVANRIIALFDNDTGAAEALLSLREVTLPRNLKVMKLPDTDLLHSYPTVGPNGNAQMDISGAAAGIELYLGNDVLTRSDGSKREVRWTGYSSKLKRYQGELIEKSDVQKLFLKKLENCTAAQLRQDPDMAHVIQILRSIINAFSDELKHDILRHAEEMF